MAMGIAKSLPEALRQATTQLARWLEKDYGLTANESGIVLSYSLRYRRDRRSPREHRCQGQ
jgi:hypothetical protein